MKKKIIIDFDKNRVTTVGRVSDRDINLAIARLRLRQTKPSRRDRIKKAFRCLKKRSSCLCTNPTTPSTCRSERRLRLYAPSAINKTAAEGSTPSTA